MNILLAIWSWYIKRLIIVSPNWQDNANSFIYICKTKASYIILLRFNLIRHCSFFSFSTCQCFLNVSYCFGVLSLMFLIRIPANIYWFKLNNGKTRRRCGICSKLTKKIPERHHWRYYGVFGINFKYISHIFLVFVLST